MCSSDLELLALSRSGIKAELSLPAAPATPVAVPGGIIAPVAAPLFKEYLLAFELTSIVLLVAIIGAVVLAKKRSAQ